MQKTFFVSEVIQASFVYGDEWSPQAVQYHIEEKEIQKIANYPGYTPPAYERNIVFHTSGSLQIG